MIKLILKNKLLIILLITVVILFCLRLFIKPKQSQPVESSPPILEKDNNYPSITASPSFLPSLFPSPSVSLPSPKRMTETEASEEDFKQTLILYPLILFLPIENDHYSLTYSAPLTLKATVKNINLSKEEIEKEIKTWISSKNVNPSTHKIEFK